MVADREKDHYKEVKEVFSDPDAVVLCEDEMVLTQGTTTPKVWIPKGTTQAVIETNGTKKAKRIYGFLNLKTSQEHAFSTMPQTMHETAAILSKIRKLYPTRKILLSWDGAWWHCASVAQGALVLMTSKQYISPIFYRTQSQERVWEKGKAEATHNRLISKIESTTKELVDYLNANTFLYSLLDFTKQLRK